MMILCCGAIMHRAPNSIQWCRTSASIGPSIGAAIQWSAGRADRVADPGFDRRTWPAVMPKRLDQTDATAASPSDRRNGGLATRTDRRPDEGA